MKVQRNLLEQVVELIHEVLVTKTMDKMDEDLRLKLFNLRSDVEWELENDDQNINNER